MNAFSGKIQVGVALCVAGAMGCAAYGIAAVQATEASAVTPRLAKKEEVRGSIQATMDKLYAERNIAGEISRFDRVPEVSEKAVVADVGDVLPNGVNAEKMRATQARMSSLYAVQNIPNEIMSIDKAGAGFAAKSK